MEAAARLFRDRGYRATSMRDLAQAVDLRASSLYNHIQSKQDILRDICFTNARRFQLGIEEIAQKDASAEAKVRDLLYLHIQVATEDITSIISFNDEWRHLESPHLERFRQLRQDYEHRFRAIIERGMADGEFRPADPTITLYTLLSSVRWIYDWYRPGRSLDLEAVGESVATVILNGLRAR